MTRPSGEAEFGSGEALLRRETIAWVHSFRDDGLFRDGMATVPTTGFPGSPGRYAPEGGANNLISMQHNRLAFRPLVHGARIGDIALMHVLVPTPYYEHPNEVDGEVMYETVETPQWNDVFIELQGDHEQQIGKYFMNYRIGPIPYRTVQRSRGQPADIVRNYEDYEQTGDFFVPVHGGELTAADPNFTIMNFRQLLGTYVMAKQDL